MFNNDDYKKIPTTRDVWVSITKSHPELRVFSSYSAPGGDYYGDPSQGVMKTTYGFDSNDFPIISANTTWDIDPEKPHERPNEKHQYWICIGIMPEEV